MAYLHFMSCYEGFVKAVYSHAATATETHRTATGAICVHNLGYIGLDVHKKSISYRMKDASDQIYAEGTIPATRFDLDRWLKTLNSLNRPVTLLKSDAQYSQSFGEGQTTGKNPTQDGQPTGADQTAAALARGTFLLRPTFSNLISTKPSLTVACTVSGSISAGSCNTRKICLERRSE